MDPELLGAFRLLITLASLFFGVWSGLAIVIAYILGRQVGRGKL